LTLEQAATEIEENKGNQFSSEVATAFLQKVIKINK
jgi:HD-GYP domain-containing protein (c-di-GMP phosphodiesterase class II)